MIRSRLGLRLSTMTWSPRLTSQTHIGICQMLIAGHVNEFDEPAC